MIRFLLLLISTILCFSRAEAVEIKKVLISQVVQHAALDATTKGIIDGLESHGFKIGENLELRVESPQGNTAVASQIAVKFIAQLPDVVVGVGTISAQSFMRYAAIGKAKLIFSSITDPVTAGLVLSLDKPQSGASGISNFVPLEPQLELFRKIQPNLKRLGVLYNPGENNSVSIIKKLSVLCEQLGLTLVKQAAVQTADISQSATRLANNCDAIFVSNDNTALSGLQSVLQAAGLAKIPVYISDTDSMGTGALAALGPNQYAIGLQTARMIVAVLNGADINNLSVEFPDQSELYIDSRAADKLGISIPSELLNSAKTPLPRAK